MTTGFNYNDVIENERIPLKNEFYYSDSITTCGVVYAKLYEHDSLLGNSTAVAGDVASLDRGSSPSVCNMAALDISEMSRLNVTENAQVEADHNVVIGYFGREITDNENLGCVEHEDSIINYNFPVIDNHHHRFGFGNVVTNHPVRFVRNLVANKTCDAPVNIDENGYIELFNIRSSENLPMLSKHQISDSECHIVVGKLYYSHDISNVATVTLAGGNYDKKTKVITAGLDIGRTDIYGRHNGIGYYGTAPDTVEYVFGNTNVLVAAVSRPTYNILGYRAYKEFYQSQQTGNITEYARLQGISKPNFIGTLSYQIDCPKKYLADAEYSFNDVVGDENLPLGISLRLNDGSCFQNVMKTYNAADYDQRVPRLHSYNFKDQSGNIPVFEMLSLDRLRDDLYGSYPEAFTDDRSIAETYGEHNAVLSYSSVRPTSLTSGSPYYAQAARESSGINEYEHLNEYNTSFVSNLMFPVECDGTEALNAADVQEYINDHGNVQLLTDSADRDTTTGGISHGMTAVGGALLGGAIVGTCVLAYKFIKSRFGASSKYKVEQKNTQADTNNPQPTAIV